jgi:integrase/recombinase XerD
MNSTRPLGQLLQSFFVDHLITVKGLRPASVRSYRDTIRLLQSSPQPTKAAKSPA